MIRRGVIGYGGRIHGSIDHVLRRLDPSVQVVGVVDSNEEGTRTRLAECDRQNAVFYKSVDKLVRRAKPDALAIGTRCSLHSPYAVQVARYDLPLFLEKPVAVTLKQATDPERAFRKSRCQVVVSFPLRVSPLCELARRDIAGGAVGDPVHVTAVNYVPYGTVYWEQPYRDYDIFHGLFRQKATRDFDYLSCLMGSPILRVTATATRGQVFGAKKKAGLVSSRCKEQDTCLESPQNHKRNGSGGSPSDHLCLFNVDCGEGHRFNEDASSALLEFASRAHWVYTQVFSSRRDAAACGATVSWYLGTVGFDWYANALKRVRHRSPFSAVERVGEGASHLGGDQELGYSFLELIRTGKGSRTPIQTGIQSAYACLAAVESAKQGRYVKVRQVSC
ncbi:MAG: Gfo/Idh/MocA family oxidoreductase [Candidatus Handelsmanbacteria bacterium]|nr:Gfo/Idh/MocA family oxidoreductase [Candidatus Handelsmanbacteria bacterium]